MHNGYLIHDALPSDPIELYIKLRSAKGLGSLKEIGHKAPRQEQ
jgi:hypothetical protein